MGLWLNRPTHDGDMVTFQITMEAADRIYDDYFGKCCWHVGTELVLG